MSFIESVKDSIGIENALIPPKFRIQILGDEGGYFEGVKKVDVVSNDKIIFSYSEGRISIEGNNLKLIKYLDGDIAVKGDIIKWEKNK